MSARAPLLAIALLAVAPRAHAGPFSLFSKDAEGGQPRFVFTTTAENPTHEPPQAFEPGYFNGVGTTGRYWELRSTTALDVYRMFTERLELARAFTILPRLVAVARISVGAEDFVPTGAYAIQGPIFGLGLRYRSHTAAYWAELGLRGIPPWTGPLDDRPSSQQVAFHAALASSVADDAAWLPFSDFGWQAYGAFQARTDPWTFPGDKMTILGGVLYGAKLSLAPLSVRTWLGSQTGFIGNVYIELFLDVPRIAGEASNLQIGVHGELSLSSIWPGDEPFPMLANGFVGWSPKSWIAVRFFGGPAGSPQIPASIHYGARLELYAP